VEVVISKIALFLVLNNIVYCFQTKLTWKQSG
jgi:hypothetical protein